MMAKILNEKNRVWRTRCSCEENFKVVKAEEFNFGALVVVGNYKGQVGYGLGKAAEVADAIRKAGEDAKEIWKQLQWEELLFHMTQGKHSGAQVLIRPASEGTR